MIRVVLTLVLAVAMMPGIIAQSSFTIDMGTASNYISHGRTLSNNLPCFQPSAAYALPKGTTLSAWFSLPYDRTTAYNDEWNVIVDQTLDLFKNKRKNPVNMHGYVDYFLNPRTMDPSVEPSIYHGVKLNAGIHAPFVLVPMNKLTLTAGYDYYHYELFGEGRDLLRSTGIHEILVKFNKSFERYGISHKSVISNNRGAINPNIDPGWGYFSQHLSFLLSTKNVTLQASLNYQWTLEKTLHNDDIYWFTLNLSRGFKI